MCRGSFLYKVTSIKGGIRMGEHKKLVPGAIDKESQFKQRISQTEELILKPHEENGLENLTEEEIEQYCQLNIDELREKGISEKILFVAKTTKEFIEANKEALLKKIQERQREKENDEREI